MCVYVNDVCKYDVCVCARSLGSCAQTEALSAPWLHIYVGLHLVCVFV